MDQVEPERGSERLLGALLRIPYQALTLCVQEGLAAAGYPTFHPSHMTVMQHIRPEGTGMSELVERLQMTKQALNYLVEYLEQQGYVERLPDPHDGRAKIVRLTAQGREMERQARKIIQQTQAEWAESLGAERMAQLHELLRDLASLIEHE